MSQIEYRKSKYKYKNKYPSISHTQIYTYTSTHNPFISFIYFRIRIASGTAGEKTLNAGAYVQLHMCSRRKEKKEKSPVRWSGLISEISTEEKFFYSSLFSLSPLLHKCIHVCLPLSLFLPCSLLPLVFLAPSATRESPGFINVRHYRFSRAASHFYFYLQLRDSAFDNRGREKV